MPTLDAELDPTIFDDLRHAGAALPPLEAAGVPLKFWEAYCLATGHRSLFRREVRRLAGPGNGDFSPEFFEQIRLLRSEVGPLIPRLRKLFPTRPFSFEDSEREEMILGFVASSPAARHAAGRWVAEPERHRREAADKLRRVGEIAEGYRKAIRAEPVAKPEIPAAPLTTADEVRAPEASKPVPPSSEIPVRTVPEPSVPSTPTPEPTESPRVREEPAPPVPFQGPGAAGRLAPAVDLEKLLDLRRVDRLRGIYRVTAQKIEVWEVLCLLAEEGHDARREMERVARMDEAGDSHEFQEGAATLFDKVLRVRAGMDSTVRRARGFLESLKLPVHEPETLEIALGLLVSASKGRARVQLWLAQPDDHRHQAAAYLIHALSIADQYRKALRSR